MQTNCENMRHVEVCGCFREIVFLLQRISRTHFSSFYVDECRVHHYCIERQQDGTVMIPDGRKFPGPVELIQHHSQYLDGFLTKPRIPCARPNGTVPMAWPGVTMLELEQILLEEAETTHNLITVRTARFPETF